MTQPIDNIRTAIQELDLGDVIALFRLADTEVVAALAREFSSLFMGDVKLDIKRCDERDGSNYVKEFDFTLLWKEHSLYLCDELESQTQGDIEEEIETSCEGAYQALKAQQRNPHKDLAGILYALFINLREAVPLLNDDYVICADGSYE